jgi:hypothetical protein
MLSHTGFIGVLYGREMIEIGKNKINEWFYDNVDMSNITRVVGAVDKENRKILWIFPGLRNEGGIPSEGVIYDLDSNRWSRFELDIQWIYGALGAGLSLDQLDAVSASLDDLPESLDSRRWLGGALQLFGFNVNGRSGSFSGNTLPAMITTRESQLIPGSRAYVGRVRSENDDVTSETIAVGTREKQSDRDSISWTSEISEARDGGFPMRSSARYHRFRVSMSGNFRKARGIKITEISRHGTY